MDHRCINPSDAAGKASSEAGVKAYRFAAMPTPRLRGSSGDSGQDTTIGLNRVTCDGPWLRPAPGRPTRTSLSSAAAAYEPRSVVGPDSAPGSGGADAADPSLGASPGDGQSFAPCWQPAGYGRPFRRGKGVRAGRVPVRTTSVFRRCEESLERYYQNRTAQ